MPTELTDYDPPLGNKFIFVTGGVMSGLGKGITAASTGRLLANAGFDVTALASNRPVLAAVMPLPSPDITPPVTKMNLFPREGS